MRKKGKKQLSNGFTILSSPSILHWAMIILKDWWNRLQRSKKIPGSIQKFGT